MSLSALLVQHNPKVIMRDQRRGVYFIVADNFEMTSTWFSVPEKMAMRYNPVLGVEKDHHKDLRSSPVSWLVKFLVIRAE